MILSFTDHLNYITSKINKNIGYFYKARHILDHKELINLYHSFIEPYITYCLPVWGGYVNLESNTNPVINILNRLKRIITFSKRTYLADKRISLFNLKQYYTLEMAKTAYTHIQCPDQSPKIYHKLMKKVTDIHNVAT